MSRAALVGACYGALLCGAAPNAEAPGGGVPAPWVALLNNGPSVLEAARQLVELRRDGAAGA